MYATLEAPARNWKSETEKKRLEEFVMHLFCNNEITRERVARDLHVNRFRATWFDKNLQRNGFNSNLFIIFSNLTDSTPNKFFWQDSQKLEKERKVFFNSYANEMWMFEVLNAMNGNHHPEIYALGWSRA